MLVDLLQNLPAILYRAATCPPWRIEYLAGNVAEISGMPVSAPVCVPTCTASDAVHPEDWERLELAPVPACLRGVPIAFIVAGLMSMAFMGFLGLIAG